MRTSLLLTLTLTAGLGLGAAEIVLTDGQVIEGTVVEEQDSKVVIAIDTGAGESARIAFHKDRIASVSGQEPNEDTPAANQALAAFKPGKGAYALIPIQGAIGVDVTAKGIQEAITTARRAGIKTLVFELDSEGWGELEEARKIAKILHRYRPAMEFQVYAKHCLGSALVFAVHAHGIHLAPEARIGGPALGTDDDEGTAVVRADIAYGAAEVAQRYGRSGVLLRAMIDPAVELAVWTDDGEVRTGSQLPSDAAERAITTVAAGELLVLTAADFAKAGIDSVSDVGGLGSALGRSNWTDASEAVVAAMREVEAREAKRRAREDRHVQRRVERVTERRDASYSELSRAITRAKSWDPDQGHYDTYKAADWWYDRWGGSYQSGGYDTGLMTNESKKEWRLRTDRTMAAIKDALLAVRAAEKHEEEAAKLGLERKASEPELKQLYEDLNQRYELLEIKRNKQ